MTDVYKPLYPLRHARDTWIPEGNNYRLNERFCYPASSVRLVPDGETKYGNPAYEVRLENVETGKAIQAARTYSLDFAKRTGLVIRHNDNGLKDIGIVVHIPFTVGQRVVVAIQPRNYSTITVGATGVVQKVSLSYIAVIMDGTRDSRHFIPTELTFIKE
jgi:ribosomal protein L19